MTLLERHIKDILHLCKSHKVKSLYAFGSVLTDKFSIDSDIDLIVDFEQIDVLDYGDNYYELKFSLENILNRNVDLLEEKAIKNPFFRKSITQKKKLIYGR
jgi:predicted nucleotidyltransferase